MSQSRQLAAIMFTDIVGYTALMGKDEEQAFEILKKNRQIQRPLIDRHNGKLLKEMGDGMLASFNTVSDAVYCGLEIQKISKEEAGFQLRIGIHLGEVVFEKNDVFGDGVNIASRIQSIAPEGHVVVSESVYRNIANKKGLLTEFWKEEMLKNVDTPVKIYTVRLDSNTAQSAEQFLHRPTHSAKTGIGKKKAAGILLGVLLLIAAGIFIYPKIFSGHPGGNTSSSITEKKSIAVLPFTDMSAEKNQEYLADGIAEEILYVLNNLVKDLKVTGRTSSFSFKGKNTDLKTVGKTLNVQYILEGSIKKFGDVLRVTVNLINTENDSTLWSDQYERAIKDILSVQTEIATMVGEKLKLTLFAGNVNTESITVDPEAFDLVMRGNYYFYKGPEGMQDAVGYFKKAIAEDTSYAYPYIRLGWALYQLTLALQYPSSEGFALAKKEIEKGLSLAKTATDKNSAYNSLAYINLWQYHWKEAWSMYEKAAAINPKKNDFLAFYQSLVLGKTSDAVHTFSKVIEENPVDLLNLRDFAILQSMAKQNDDVRKTCRKIIELSSSFSEAYRIEGQLYLTEKKIDSALLQLKKAVDMGNPWAPILSITALGYAGKKEEAQNLYAQADSMMKGKLPPIARALVLYHLGDHTKAFEWLNRSYEEKDFYLAFLRVDPLWDPMRSDTRFKNIQKKMNFPE